MTHNNSHITLYHRYSNWAGVPATKNMVGLFKNNSGFTLVELLMIIVIIGILATLALPGFNTYRDKTKSARALNELRVLGTEISGFILDKQSTPPDLAAINRANFLDPWKRVYVYTPVPALEDVFFSKLNTDYDLYSPGKDGLSAAAFSDPTSKDDVVRFNDGAFFDYRDK